MQTVDRRGIHIEQCQGCRGIFLDRGELEQISNAEQSHYAAAAPPPYDAPPQYGAPQHAPPPPQYGAPQHAPPPQQHYGHGGYRDSPPPYGSHGHKPHKRKSFMEDLFG